MKIKTILSLSVLFLGLAMLTTACKNKNSNNSASNDLLTEARNLQKGGNTKDTKTTTPSPTTPPTTETKVAINGRNVKSITYEHNNKQGTFTQNADKKWTESTIEGNTFYFAEQGRDEWSVYLTDTKRDIKTRLDLHTKKVYVNGSPHYKITDSSI